MVLPQPQNQNQNQNQIQVQDSVLNYVNASFQQPQGDLPKADEQGQEQSPFNAHLRRYDGAQVWRIVVQTDKDKRLADELQSKYGEWPEDECVQVILFVLFFFVVSEKSEESEESEQVSLVFSLLEKKSQETSH